MGEYIESEELTKLGKLVIEKMKWKITPKIKFLILQKDNSNYVGKCSLATGKWRYLIDYDFIIEVWDGYFDSASDHEREALLHHELMHITFREKDGIIKWKTRRHDLEEFQDTAHMYGLWSSSLKAFAKIIME